MSRNFGDDPADEALVRNALAGDDRAFQRLLERHEARVMRTLRLMGIPSRDREDVAQEVFLRVFRSLNGFRPGGSFAGWIYRTAVHAAHDYRLRHARAPAVFLSEETAERPDEAPGPAEAARARELRRRLQGALEALSDRERAVFVLREVEGLETGQVARILGITRVTVRRHLGLARKRLQAWLSERGEL